MKQDKAKRTPKWLLPVIIAAAVLVIAGVVLAIFLGSGEQAKEPEKIESELYWNVDRSASVDPETGISIREPDADGLYTIRFAVNGEQVDLKAADKRLVNSIDFMDVMGLVFDADGMIIEAVNPTVIYKELAKDFFVKSVSETTIVANSSIAMNGMEVQIPLSEATGIYNVDPANQVIGQPDTCKIMDRIIVYGNEEGVTTHVFMTERARGDGAYFRVDKFYDKTTGETTREPDENGAYTMLFAYEGEQLNLKCKDKALVSKLDSLSDSKNIVGLIFDEEGYIVDYVDVAVAIRGKLLCRLMNVTAIDGNTVTIEDFVGDGADGTMDLYIDADCDIFIIENECEADFIGQRMDGLKLGDMVWVYTDLEGKPILVYIQRRVCDFDMYYSMSRKYSTEKQETTREPDENGWYVFDMVTKNKRVEMRTKSKELASRVDSFQYKLVGLKTSGTTILDVCGPYCLSGYSHVGIGRFVTQTMGTIVRIVNSAKFESGGNYMFADDVIMIDATGDYSAKAGSQVTLREGDRITGYTNPRKQISHGVVTNRYYEGTKLYYNVNRQYDSTLLETKRVPDADGYYVFDMICEGKEVQVKTKDKDMATFIDKDSYGFRALKVSGGIIKGAYQNVSALKYSVRAMANYFYDSTNPDGTINFYYMSNGERVDKTTTYAVTDKTVIYNYSSAANKVGEKTTLKKGDKLQAFASMETKEMLVMFVLERKVESKLYWHVAQSYNSTTMETTRTPDADGYYWIEVISEDGERLTFKTKDKKVMSRADSYPTAFGLTLDGDVILQAHSHEAVKGIAAYSAGYYDAMKISGNKVSFVRNRPASASTGRTSELMLKKGYKVVNVTKYSDNYGQKDKIDVGDRLCSYVNENNEIVCTFIVNKNTHQKGAISYCPHCGKDVWWEHFGGTVYKADCHYYVTHDSSSSSKAFGYTAAQLAADPTLEDYEIIFDLNGCNWNLSSYQIALVGKCAIVDTVGGGKIQLSGSSVLTVKNETIGWPISAIGNTKIILEGKVDTAKDAKIKLDTGLILDITNLSPDSKLAVSANGVFTSEREDIDKYLDCFVPADEGGKIEKVGNALTYIAPKVEYTTEKIIEVANSAEFAANFANGGVVTAVCPVCGIEKDWTPIGAGTETSPKTTQQKITGHVYYDKDTWTTSVNILTSDTDVGCVYLNGKTVNGIGRIRITKNISFMGPGKIIKSDNQTTNANNAMFVLDSSNTKLNIYGGEFVNKNANKPMFEMTATNAKGTGTVYAGSFESAGAMVDMNKQEAELNLLGGTFKGTAAQINLGTLTIGSANVQNDVVADIAATIVLTEKPNMTGALDLSSGALATLKDLDTAASILVKANGTFTQPTDKAADYITAQTFKIPTGYQAVTNDNGCLWTAPEGYVPPESTTPDWSDNAVERVDQWTAYYGGDFNTASEAGTAAGTVFTEICPVCGARNVTWTAKNSLYTPLAPSETGSHFYLSESYGRTTQDMIGSSQKGTLCLYLNNKTYTTIGRFFVKAQVNIFDDNQTADGGITRIPNTYATAETPSKTGYLALPMFAVTTNGELNIYGGDFENQQTIVGTYNPDGTPLINVSAANSKVNIYGGTFTHTGNGATLNAVSGTINIAGGNLSGKMPVAAEAKVTLSGAPVISGEGLDLTSGAKITLGDLATTANIAVKANGFFTEANDKAAEYAASMIFSVPEGYEPVTAVENVLWTDVEGTPVPEQPTDPAPTEPDPTDPEQPTDPEDPEDVNPTVQAIDQWLATYAADFTAASAAETAGSVTTATCPICGAENVTWTARTANNAVNAANGAMHYYLYTDVVRNTFDAVGSSQAHPVCIYLNNKTYSTTGSFQVKNTLNIFDDPNVAGGKVLGADGTEKGSSYIAQPLLRLTKDANNAAPVLNIYYGEYESAQPHVEGVNDNGTVLVAAQVAEVQAYIYGATLSNTGHGEAIRVTAGSVELDNCTVNNGVNFEGGALTLSGKTDIPAIGLVIAEGKKITLDKLMAESRIHVTAQGIFTEVTDKAAEYVAAGTFSVPTGYQAVAALQDLLWTGVEGTAEPEYPFTQTPEQQLKAKVDAWVEENKAAFTAGENLPTSCPFCGETGVTWEAKANKKGGMKAGHFYLADGYVSYTNMNLVNMDDTVTETTCVYLNGQNAEIIGRMKIYGGATLNIFGEGTIIKNHTDKGAGGSADYTKAAIFDINDTATVNIYGGTYINNQKYVDVAGVVSNPTGTPVIDVRGAATVNIYGATFQTAADANGEVIRSSAASTINLYAGTVTGGTATHANSIYMQAGALTIGDANITGNVAVDQGATITLTGKPVISMLDLTSGVLATVTELTEGTSVTVKANGKFTAETEKAAEYAPWFTAAEGYETVTPVENALFTQAVSVQATQLQDEVTVAAKA